VLGRRGKATGKITKRKRTGSGHGKGRGGRVAFRGDIVYQILKK